MKRIRLSVDALVLKGFRHEDRHAIAAGLTQEFTRLLADPRVVPLLTAVGDVPCLRAGSVAIERSPSPRQIGAAAARQIGKGMGS